MEPKGLVIYDRVYIEHFLRPRPGETKLGERIRFLDRFTPWQEALEQSDARYVLLGLPEDIGVRANLGRGGAHTAWEPFLQFFLNTQHNGFNRADDLLLLGHMDFTALYDRMLKLDLHHKDQLQEARKLVEDIDSRVAPLIETLVRAGKVPIVIGGGHNNAYPLLKGASNALGTPVGALNIDPHADLREREGRHSGNGFRYAFEEGYLNYYSIFGLHENYLAESVEAFMQAHNRSIRFVSFEDLAIRFSVEAGGALDQLLEPLTGQSWGLELDADGIQNFPASARTSSGWGANEVRRWVYRAASNPNLRYFHLCEAAPVLAHRKADIKTGKLLSYLVTDFLKAQRSL